MTIGIYCIQNDVNGKRYIGKSLNIERRMWSHKNKLTNPVRDKKSCNEFIHSDVQQYGWDAFSVSTLETFNVVDECLIAKRELQWMRDFNTIHPNGYNLRLDSQTAMIVHPLTRLKISNNNIGKKNPNYGNKWSDEKKKRMSDIKKQQHKDGLYCEEWRSKIGENSKRFWKENLDVKNEMAKKVSERKKKYNFHQFTEDGELLKVWYSIDDILKENPSWKWQNIYSVCNGYKKRIYGFKWVKVLKHDN